MKQRQSFTVTCWIVVTVILQQLSTTKLVYVYAQSSNFIQTLVPCGGNDTLSRNFSGYVTIEAMNLDMQVELDQIRNGRPPQEPYVFPLCPDSVFDLSIEPLRPVLSGSIFICGLTGNISLGCEFRGGTDQIIIGNSSIDTNSEAYVVQSVNFIGITYTGFTNSVLSGGSANSLTTIDITRASFQNFNAPSVVRQVNDEGVPPFKVVISESILSNAMGTVDGTAFMNIGGELSMQDVTLDSSNLVSFVTTGSSTVNIGSTFLRGVTITNSEISDVFIVMQAADIDAIDVTVNEMSNMLTVFDIVGADTTAVLENIIIRSNNIAQSNPSNLWVGISIRENAIGTISKSTFIDNTNVRHVLSASMNATLDIQSSRITGASGGRVVNERDISSGVFSNIQSMVTLTNVIIEDTTSFTAIYFAGGGSSMTIRNTCIGEGNNQGTIYISEESNYIAESNFIDPSFVSSVCEESGIRLIQELPGSGCFDANRTDCEFNCTSFVEVDTCNARLETFAPSIAPINMTQPPTVTNNTTLRPTVATSTPSSVGITASPQPSAPTIQPSSILLPLSSATPIVLPPSFTATSSPITDTLPTSLPTDTPAPSIENSLTTNPSLLPRPSLRPTTHTSPTFFETELPTSTIPPSTSKPSCDCYSGKGKKSKKKKGKDKGKGSGNGRNDDGIFSNDDDLTFYHRRNVYSHDKTDDYDDDCICRESKKGKGKGKDKGKGNGDHGKGKGSHEKGHESDSYIDVESETHQSNARVNHIFQLLERNDNQR